MKKLEGLNFFSLAFQESVQLEFGVKKYDCFSKVQLCRIVYGISVPDLLIVKFLYQTESFKAIEHLKTYKKLMAKN